MKNKFIIMDIDDNCGTALEVISKDDIIDVNGNRIKISQSIDMGHKFAIKDIKKGNLIKKYGEIIGIAIEDIKVGEWIHTHNVTSHYLERIKND